MAGPQDIHPAGGVRLAHDIQIGAGAQVGSVPLRDLPDDFLGGGDLEELHAAGPFFLRASGHPAGDQGIAVLQAGCGLQVVNGEGNIVLGDLPYGFAFGVNLPDVALAVAAEQIMPVREFVHMPGEMAGNALQHVAFWRNFQDLLLLHQGQHEIALRRTAHVTELSVAAFHLAGYRNLPDHLVQARVPDDDLAGVAVEGEIDQVRPQRLAGVGFRARRDDIFPQVLALAVEQAQLGHGGIEDGSVRQKAHVVELQHAVPFITQGQGILEIHLPVLDDAQDLRLRVAGVPFADVGVLFISAQTMVLGGGAQREQEPEGKQNESSHMNG